MSNETDNYVNQTNLVNYLPTLSFLSQSNFSGNSFWRTIEEWVLDGHLSGYNVQTGSHSTVGHMILANRALLNFRLLLRNKGIPNPNFLETKKISLDP